MIATPAHAADKKPNILVIFGDDIGMCLARTISATATSSCPPCMSQEEPEELDYPGQKNPAYKEKSAPRDVLHAWTTDKDDPTEQPKWGRVGKQRIENDGQLTRKRMETSDGEVLAKTLDYLDRKGKDGKPFFLWFNTTAIHIWSHSTSKYIQMAVDEGRAVGALLQKPKTLGVEDNTIVIYSTARAVAADLRKGRLID